MNNPQGRTEKDLIELYEERAAIMEYLGGLPRQEAESQAYTCWRLEVGATTPAPKAIQDVVSKARGLPTAQD